MFFRGLRLAFLAIAVGTVFSFAGDLTLIDGGQTDYMILLPESPTPAQTSAAYELTLVLEEISGVRIPTKRETAETAEQITPSDKLLVIGPSASSKKLLGDVDESAIGYDGILIKRVGSSLVFSGHPKRGPLYAVYTFLEDVLGCKWWTPAERTIPHSEKITVGDLDIAYAPKLIYRESFYTNVIGEENGPFAAHLKCNGNSENIPEELGGHHSYLYFVHSFYQIIPATEYEEHPDWFSEIDGVRKVGYPYGGTPEYHEMVKRLKPEQISRKGSQLCLCNEELYQTMLHRVLEGLEKNPNATIVSISQNDWEGYCECEKCRKVAEEEGTYSGSVLRFANRMAEDIEKVRPDVYVDTLAYRYTRQPPKNVVARDNVIVRLCSIESSFVQNLASEYGQPFTRDDRRPAEEAQNESFRADIEGWNKHAKHLFIWDYMTDFWAYLLPFPNYRVWADNIRFFVDHNSIGIFEQGDFQAETGDFTQLRAWVVAKLLWNPELSQRDLMEEYIAGYYAPELVPVFMSYFDLLSDAYEKTGKTLEIYRRSAKDWIDIDTYNQAAQLFDRAEETARELEAKDSQKYANLLYKVRRERIPLDLVLLMDYAAFHKEAEEAGKEFRAPKPEEMKAYAEDFIARLDKAGLTTIFEGSGPEDLEKFKQELLDKNTDPLKAEAEEK